MSTKIQYYYDMLQNNLFIILFTIVIWLYVTESVYCQSYRSGQEIALSLTEGIGPRGMTSFVISSLENEDEITRNLLKPYNLDSFQGINNKKEFAYIVNKFQFYYQAYKNGDISAEYFYDVATMNQWSLQDSVHLSSSPLNNVIRILTGQKDGDEDNHVCIIDANQNGTYEDDVITYIPKIKSMLDDNIQPISVELDFYVNKKIQRDTIKTMLSFGYQGNLGISFYSYYLGKIKYKGQKFIICSDFFDRQSIYVLPDMPYFSSISRTRRILDLNKIVLLNDTLNVCYNKYNNTVSFQDKDRIEVKMEIEDNFRNHKSDITNVNIGFKNIEGIDFINGENVSLNNFEEKWILLYFWSDNCGPCIQSLPLLNQLNKRFGKQLELIGVVDIFGQKNHFTNLLKENKVSWHNIESPKDSEIRDFYAVRAYPTIYLINTKGEIVKNYLSTAELEDVLITYLKN